MPTCDADLALRRADRLRAAPASSRDASSVPKRIFLNSFGNSFCEEVEHLLRFGRAGGVLDAGVDVFGVLAEDHHVDLLRMLHRRRHALEPAHRAQADVQVEHLPQRDVQRADAAADRRGQRALDADEVLAERLDRLVRQPVVELLEALLAGVDFHPRDLPLAAVGLLDGGVEHADAGAPDVRAGAVAFDERDDRIVRHDELVRCVRRRWRRCALVISVLGQVTCRRAEDFREAVENSVENGRRLRRCDAAFRMF